MTHPVIWPKNSSFHPINDSPPVCLTQDLSPEKSAEILLLGCGDPGSILYTVFTDLGPKNRPLDITCCDWEPAVLARNILLLTMIVDGVAVEAAWSVFYHFFLDEAFHDILITQCHTLTHSSSTIKTWRESKYGRFLRFCTENSLAEIRRHWVLYLESQNDTEEERKAFKESFSSGMKSVHNLYGDQVHSSRAAGPLFFAMVKDGHASQSHKNFWTTGVTPSKLSREAMPYVNPTFAYSVAGKKFNVHYATDPLMAFHLAPAFAPGKGGRQRLSGSLTTDDFAKCAKSEFSSWCSSFRARLFLGPAANIVIRFFVGESFALCQALHICKEQKSAETGVYAHPWDGSLIVFDDDYCDSSESSATSAPLLFNMIETSDLANHVGIVNLLVATVPLMQKMPWSTIHTFTSLWSHTGNSPKSTLSNNVCGDIPTFSMLMGVAPSPHLWHFTPHFTKHAVVGPNRIPCELHESISWRFISSFIPNVPPISDETDMKYFNFMCDEHTLAKYFFAIYLRMFADENPTSALKDKAPMLNVNNQDLLAVHYTRASFVALLALVKGSVRVNWAQTMNHLIDLIGIDKTLVIGMNSFQDLSCQLHMRDVHTFQVLALDIEPLRTSYDRFQGWKDVPPIVCVVLKVPRRLLKYVEDMNVDDIVTPMLQCEVHGSDFHHVYSSIHLTFGDILSSIVDGESQVTIKEDPHGWRGTSPLIATFYVPSWTLTSAPTATLVGLHFRGALTTQPLSLLARLGGEDLTIFSTSLMDKSHVQIVRHRPNNAQEIKHLRNTNGYNTPMASANIKDITIKFDPIGERATNLIMRKNITEPDASRELAGGSKVSTQPLSDSSVLVAFGDYMYRFNFPFAVDTSRMLMRIARSSSYIEIESPIRPDFADSPNTSRNPFVVAYDHNQINLLNIHYLNLDTLPSLLVSRKGEKRQWVTFHIMTMYSAAERREKDACTNPEDRAPLINLKMSICTIFVLYTKPQIDNHRERSSVFCLLDPRNRSMDTLFFVNAIKFDLGSHTVVIDACAVPLKGTDVKLYPALTDLTNKGIPGINKSYNEIRLWKLLMPTLAERCRTWKHTETCEYRTRGIPASLEGMMHSPLCSCGKGKNLGWFGTVAEWAPFHKEATRIAIGPLFTFSSMEDTLRVVASEKNLQSVLQKKLCARCGRIGRPSLQTCGACLKVRYCSPECQRAHWKTHKPACLAARLAT